MSKTKKYYPILENLFNSKIRVKILKFLFRNHPTNVGVRELASRIQEPYNSVRHEIKAMERINLVIKN